MEKKENGPSTLEHTMGAMTRCLIPYSSHVGRLVGIVGCHMLVAPMTGPIIHQIILHHKETKTLIYIQVCVH